MEQISLKTFEDVSLTFKDYYNPFNENDKPSWEKHVLFHLPINIFKEIQTQSPAGSKWNVLDIGEARFQYLLEKVKELDFKPDLLFSNSGDLQGWPNFHIHAIKGKRTNPDCWSVFDTFDKNVYSQQLKIGDITFPYTEVEGMRSFQDKRIDKVYAVDITNEVIEEKKIKYALLIKNIKNVIDALQKETLEMGTIVFIPTGGSYKVVYLIRQTK